MDFRTGDDQVNFDYIGCLGVAAFIRPFEHYMTLRDPIIIALQSRTQFSRAILEGTQAVEVAECQRDGRSHGRVPIKVLYDNYRQSLSGLHQGFPTNDAGGPLPLDGVLCWPSRYPNSSNRVLTLYQSVSGVTSPNEPPNVRPSFP
jgi:hypothetical protein